MVISPEKQINSPEKQINTLNKQIGGPEKQINIPKKQIISPEKQFTASYQFLRMLASMLYTSNEDTPTKLVLSLPQ